MYDTNPTILNMSNTDVNTSYMYIYIYITIIDMSYCETFAWDVFVLIWVNDRRFDSWWLNHSSEKYAREIESFPQVIRGKSKEYLKPPPSPR